MPIKLKVSKISDPQWNQENEFDQDKISIGRDIKNNICLTSKNSILSWTFFNFRRFKFEKFKILHKF